MASPLMNLWRWLNQPLYQERDLAANLFGLGVNTESGSDTAGVEVDQDSALTLEAVWTCVRLLSGDISSLPIDAFRRSASGREPIDPPPWLEYPVPLDPSVTGVDYLSQVVMSMLLDGNAFTLALPSVRRPSELHVLKPSEVEVSRDSRGAPSYKAQEVNRVLGPDQIVHTPLWRKPGQARGLSPIEAMAQGIGRGLAARETGSRFFTQGSMLGSVVEYPLEAGEVNEEQIKDLLRDLNKRHKGLKKSWAMGALTAGAKLHEVGMKPTDTQLIETEEWTLEQVCRAYGVPPSMAGSQKPGAVAYASVEQRAIDYVVHGVMPVLIRIERSHSRLLPPNNYLKFNTNGLLRGDQKSRYEAYQVALNTKFMDRGEVRALEDLAPWGDDRSGFLETPNNNSADPRYETVGALVRAGFDPEAALAALGLPSIKHIGLPPVTVQPDRTDQTQDPPKGP